MSGGARAFLIAALAALPTAALLHLLALLGLGSAWPAMVHLTLFGWITAMICAVSYHTMPVFTARDFPAPGLIWLHWAAFCVGVGLACAGLLLVWNPLVAAGLLLQALAALLFSANGILLIWRGPRRPRRPPPPPIAGQPQVDKIATRATSAAGLALPPALLLLLATRQGWVGGAWVLAAEHLAALGWTLLMIVGVAYHVLPRFSGLATRGPAWARAQLGCHLAALALMVPALGLGWTAAFAAGALLMALALGLFAWTVWPTIRRLEVGPRRVPPHQSPMIPLEERRR